jgi:hypothetical protein
MSGPVREKVRLEAIAKADALAAEKQRIASLTEDELFEEKRNEICKITQAPLKNDLVTKYLNRIKLFSEATAAVGAGLTIAGPTAALGLPMAVTGASSAVLASAAISIFEQSSSQEFKRSLKPILNLLCEFPAHRMRPAFEILFELHTKLTAEKNPDEKQILIETAKLNLVVELVEATLEEKAKKTSLTATQESSTQESGGSTRTRGRRSVRHRHCTSRKRSCTTRVRNAVARRRRTGKAFRGPRD